MPQKEFKKPIQKIENIYDVTLLRANLATARRQRNNIKKQVIV